jgi:hypothetical protein
MKVYELITHLLTMPAGADVRALNADDREALVLLVNDVEHVDGEDSVAALWCTPAPPKDAACAT